MKRVLDNRRKTGVAASVVITRRRSAGQARLSPPAEWHRGQRVRAPVQVPQSGGLGEPSLAVDSSGRLVATAPSPLGNVNGGGKRCDVHQRGASLVGPVHPVATR